MFIYLYDPCRCQPQKKTFLSLHRPLSEMPLSTVSSTRLFENVPLFPSQYPFTPNFRFFESLPKRQVIRTNSSENHSIKKASVLQEAETVNRRDCHGKAF